MNYSKKFNTTQKAIAEIKRLEKECARLAGQLSNANIILNGEPDIKETARLKKEIVQFRKTQDYQSGEIGRLQGVFKEQSDLLLKQRRKLIKCEHENEILRASNYDKNKIIGNCRRESKSDIATLRRQANEITELKAGV